jgi:hypothetical protein
VRKKTAHQEGAIFPPHPSRDVHPKRSRGLNRAALLLIKPRSFLNDVLHRKRSVLALFGHGAMTDLSPLCAPKRTSADHCRFMGSRPGLALVGARHRAVPCADPVAGRVGLTAALNLDPQRSDLHRAKQDVETEIERTDEFVR